MVNVRCQACQAKYRLLAAKRVNLLGLVLEARPQKPAPRFPYRPPIQRRPRSYIIQPDSLVYAKDNNKENRSTPTGVSSPRSTLRRQAKANNNLLLPRFYYPTGRPISKEQLDASLLRLAATFQQLPNCQASREHFGTIAKACGCPYYWKAILFIASGGEKLGHVTLETFTDFWAKIINNYHDEASRFVQLLTMINSNVNAARIDDNFNGPMNNSTTSSGRFYLVPEDFVPLVQDVVDTHPGLTFLKEAAEFHSRYVHTVIARIYYNVNRSWSGQITLAELRHSNLLATVRLLEEEEDINQITDFFSYEHFYVIYCKFWELDKDHDLFIDKKDLARHNDHALSSKMIDRIFSGAVTRGAPHINRLAKFGNTNTNLNNQPRMSYTEFVWFLISEEDKRHPTAIEYWFRCMDLDGDGHLSMYELEYFYEEQLQRMESLGIETLPFEDCLCQMLDMIHPAVPGKVSLNDLKRCQMTPIFFDTFFNLEKYLDHEQRDPFASQRDPDSENGDEILKISDWDRYAAEEYELLVAEEGGPDHSDDMFMREEMNAAEDEGNDHHSTLPLSMERDVIMAESDVADDHDDYSSLTMHSSLGLSKAGHRSLFSVTPCSIEYQY
uniref:EOG090X00JH n=1 Tax=Megafenestra aurita TaxID=2291010 RepID=A0A4Y7NIN0_9CRUS|nr:EOG090X00JH [Megafenestra aurita]SVE92215.1 EOG090X00JH [Megafenestra aurita]